MGGQVAVRGGLHLDMRQMNGLVWLRPTDRVVRVQAGMRWRDLQDLLDPLGLAVKIMQSWRNFSLRFCLATTRWFLVNTSMAARHRPEPCWLTTVPD